MEMIATYKSNILDQYTILKNKILSNRNEFLNETYHYINKYNEKMLNIPALRKYYAKLSDVINKHSKELNTKINDFIQNVLQEQKKQIEKAIAEIMNKVSTSSIEEIQTMIYNAKHNITELTREKLNGIDAFIKTNIGEALKEHSDKNLKTKLTDKGISDFTKFYTEGIASNTRSIKNKFADVSRNEIEFFEDKTFEIIKDYKNGKDLEDIKKNEELTTANNSNPELQAQLEHKIDEPENKVKMDDLQLNFIELPDLEVLLNSFGDIRLSVEDGYLVAKDSSDNKYDISMKTEDGKVTLKLFNPREENKEPIGLEIDANTKSVCVKHKDDDQGLAYDTVKNELQVKCSGIKYLIKFENGLMKGSIINDSGSEISISDEELQKAIQTFKEQGIEIDKSIELAIEESKNREVSSDRKM